MTGECNVIINNRNGQNYENKTHVVINQKCLLTSFQKAVTLSHANAKILPFWFVNPTPPFPTPLWLLPDSPAAPSPLSRSHTHPSTIYPLPPTQPLGLAPEHIDSAVYLITAHNLFISPPPKRAAAVTEHTTRGLEEGYWGWKL